MIELLDKIGFWNLILVSVGVSIFAVAIFNYVKYFQKDGVFIKWAVTSNEKKNWFVMFVSIIAVALQLSLDIAQGTAYLWQEYVMRFIFTWAFALLFYAFMGVLFVKKIFQTLKTKFTLE